MTQRLRRTVRSFLRSERPVSRQEARLVLEEWFGRYRPDPDLLDQEVDRHFTGNPLSPRPKSRAPDAARR